MSFGDVRCRDFRALKHNAFRYVVFSRAFAIFGWYAFRISNKQTYILQKVDEFVLLLTSTVNADLYEFLFQSVRLASLCAPSDVISDSLDKIWQLQYLIAELYFIPTKQCGFSGLRWFNAFNTRVTTWKWFCLLLTLLIIVYPFPILIVLVLFAPYLHNFSSIGSSFS